MEHILSLSYGKDSLACLGAIEQLGWQLDRIVHVELWATKTIHADPPPMIEFKKKADTIIKDRWGIIVEHISADTTYEEQFYAQFTEGKRIGEIYGFPMTRGAWCNDRLKVQPLKRSNKNTIAYIGIASDEPNRFHNLTDTKRSPLVEAGWDEDKCKSWCIENDLLSPIYTTATRGGCWFCHNQGVNQLRLLRKTYPQYWELLLKWDKDSPCTFKPDGRTVHDFERRFQAEDDGLIHPDDKIFRWSMLDEELNYRWF